MEGPGKWRETLKRCLDFGEKTEKRGKCDTHTLGPGIWREN